MPRIKYSLKDAHAAAAAKGGHCLSGDGKVMLRSMLRWACSHGHEWEARLDTVLKLGRWCAKCKGMARKTIGEMCDLAATKGGQCLSDFYRNKTEHLWWECAKGHKWRASYSTIQHGSWCPECAAERQRNGIEKAREAAEMHRGSCLSEEYRRNDAKLKWRCAKGHEWESSYINVVLHGHWCPSCPHKGETAVHDILARLLGDVPAKSRPAWLQGLEIDFLYPELRLAVEYNGRQHYEFIPGHFHREGIGEFHAQQKRDKQKAQLCDDNWFTLVVVPYTETDPEAFLFRELQVLGYV